MTAIAAADYGRGLRPRNTRTTWTTRVHGQRTTAAEHAEYADYAGTRAAEHAEYAEYAGTRAAEHADYAGTLAAENTDSGR
jgi:hypothetical protein